MNLKALFRPSFFFAAGGLLLAALMWTWVAGPDDPPRGHDPWVFRSVLDGHPRMVTLALRDDFWAAYDARHGALYKVWPGGVEFDGPVYTTAHGPQPVSLGDAYLVSPYASPWVVLRNGQPVEAEARYRGHRFVEGGVLLQYELHLPGGEVIHVTERPEYVRGPAGQPGLERVFTTAGVPAGTQVALETHLNSLYEAESFTTDGRFESRPAAQDGIAQDGRLFLNANGETRFTAYFNPEPQVAAAVEAAEGGEGGVHPGLLLIEGSDCQACHNPEVKTVGPSYRAIAERYATSDVNVRMLAGRIIQGGGGNWSDLVGPAVMTPHPDLTPEDAAKMAAYILSLDGEEAAQPEAANPMMNMGPSYPLFESEKGPGSQGVAVNVYRYPAPIKRMPEPAADQLPMYAGVVPALHAPDQDAFGDLVENFYVRATGYIHIPETDNYVFRLVSDDGSRLEIDGKVVIDHDGEHGPTAKDGEVYLEAGRHPFTMGYFQSGGGLGYSLQWIRHGEENFTVVPPAAFTYDPSDLGPTKPYVAPEPVIIGIPGDAQPLAGAHPSFRVETVRPTGFEPKVGGMDFLPDGRLVVSTWDPDGSVYLVSNLDSPDREQIRVKKIAAGLAEPLGVKVVDGDLYVLQKQELTQLIDHDGDEVTDEYRTVSNDWGVTSNFHEFAFGLAYEDGHFYATLATAILPGGASAQPQNPDRGKVVKISREDGSVAFVAKGLRTPNGIGRGVDGELFVADNQGDWLPASKIVHVIPGAFYGSRSVDPLGTADLEETLPVVWLPQDEIGNSPTQPAPLDVGPYENQMVHGDVTHGGLKRVFVEEVDGQYQGAVFRFTQGLEAGVNRLVWGPDGSLYVGGIGNPGNWSHYGTNWYGLQRLTYTGDPAFEMLAVRARADGMEIEFTEPLPENEGFDPEDYLVKQWWYEPTVNYGGPKMDEETLPVRSVRVSEDRKRVFLELGGLKPGHLVYLRLREPFVSANGNPLWSTEAWYTLNRIPQERGPTFAGAAPYEQAGPNRLTRAERAAGWRLLFDGETTRGWRAYRGREAPSAWQVDRGALAFTGEGEGGDLMTNEAFEDYELSLEWKIAEGGNSGIIYNVVESPAYAETWHTGPEMQVLDTERHPDGKIAKHRAGDLYDLIAAPFVATRPVGAWNRVRIVQQDGRVEHWLNGRKVVEYDMNAPAWQELIRSSKFAEMPGFGKSAKGHIALQDHGDRVWYRNIKIRPL